MSVASLLVDVLGPVLVLVVLGAVAGHRLGIDAAPLATLAYWVLGPAFMFHSLYDADLDRDLVVKLVVTALGAMIAAAAVALVVMRLARANYGRTAAAVIPSAYGNVGNAGLAISAFALGDDILPIASVLMLTINSAGLVLGVSLAAARTTTPIAALGRALVAPMSVAAWLAIAANVLDLQLALVLERPLGLLASALIPVMLLTLGMQLVAAARPNLSAELSVAIVAKLVVAPVAAALIGVAIGLTGDAAAVVVIQSAMPPAVFVALLSMEHNFEVERITSAVVATTIMSIITLPIVLALTT